MTLEKVLNSDYHLLSADTSEHYSELIAYLLSYSIEIYEEKDAIRRLKDHEKWLKALWFALDNDILLTKYSNKGKDELKSYIEVFDQHYMSIAKKNKNKVTPYTTYIEEKFVELQPKQDFAPLKAAYLFDFITNYITFVDDSLDLTERIPEIPNLHLQIQEDFPIASPTKELLVRKSGSSRSIAALTKHLGSLLKLPIDFAEVDSLKGKEYINIFIVDNKPFYIDCSSHIEGIKRDSCFLVSAETLKSRGIFPPEECNSSASQCSYNMPKFSYDQTDLHTLLNYSQCLYDCTIGKNFDIEKEIVAFKQKSL